MTIALLIGLTFIFIIIISIIKGRKASKESKTIVNTIVEQYCILISQEKYQEAYQFFNSNYTKEIKIDRFIELYQQKQIENGKLIKKKYAKFNKSYNLFSKTTTFQIYFHLTYEKNKIYGAIIVDNNAKEFKIEGTYIDSANDSLSFYIW